MRLRTFGVTFAMVLLGACGSGDAEPAGDLHNGSAAADGDTVWVVGGTVVSDEVWDQMTTPSFELPRASEDSIETGASEHAVQYDLDGHVLQDVDLTDLDLGWIPSLGGLTARSVDGGTVLAGTACLSRGDARSDGCTSTPLVLAVHDGEVERVSVGTDHGGVDDIRIVGALGPEVLVAIGPSDGVAIRSSNDVDLFAIEPSQPEARRITLPDGVKFARAVCLRGSDVVAVATDLDETVEDVAGTLNVGVVDGSGASDPTVSLPISERFPGAVAVVCRDDRVTVLELPPAFSYASETLLGLHDVDLEKGRATASKELPLTYESVPGLQSIGGDVLLMEGFDSAMTHPVRWSDGTLGQPGEGANRADGSLVVVGDRLLDVSGLLAQVPGDDAVAPTEIPVPSLG